MYHIIIIGSYLLFEKLSFAIMNRMMVNERMKIRLKTNKLLDSVSNI